MKIVKDSHLDHALSKAQIELIEKKFADRDGFFLETFELPPELGTIPCGLYGPIMGDAPVPEEEVEYQIRGDRKGASRMVSRPPRDVSSVTVIAGPHGDDVCVLYTAFGGPCMPKEPWDESLSAEDKVKSEDTWSKHALSLEV